LRSAPLDATIQRLRARLAHLGPRREAVAQGLRDRLEADVRRRLLQSPSSTLDDCVAAALEELGDVEDLDADRHGDLRRRSTGEVVVASPRMQRARPALLVLGALAAALVAGAIYMAGFQLTSDATPPAAAATQVRDRVLVERHDAHQLATQAFTDRFTLGTGTLRSSLAIQVDATQGCAFYTVTAPDGTVVSDTTSSCSDSRYESSPTQAGEYTIDVRLVAFTGTVDIVGRATERI
jgi:hypothetical protein